MEIEEKLKKALAEIRKAEPRKFNQTVDLIINLQKYSVKKNPINLFVNVPYKTKEKKIAGFFEVRSDLVDTVVPEQFKKYKDKKALKSLVKSYDFFVAQGSLMPKVATTFGRVLGPAGKMPSPQLGILLNLDEKAIVELKKKINHNIKVKLKEASVKVAVGKEDMKDEEILENILAVYSELLKVLPREKENVKNIEIKLTMSKPQRVEVR